jgi:hypothetical protein
MISVLRWALQLFCHIVRYCHVVQRPLLLPSKANGQGCAHGVSLRVRQGWWLRMSVRELAALLPLSHAKPNLLV